MTEAARIHGNQKEKRRGDGDYHWRRRSTKTMMKDSHLLIDRFITASGVFAPAGFGHRLTVLCRVFDLPFSDPLFLFAAVILCFLWYGEAEEYTNAKGILDYDLEPDDMKCMH
ncbi:hypothetical protein LXL04_035227 [Taraxacum kok-saghyz]